MRISVAMAVRNGERYLSPLLDSLARQTAPPHELVVTDDGSEDATPALLEAFAERAGFPVRVERFGERRGHVEGFMRAAWRCEGDAIAFCDADDVWREEKLEVCGRELAATGATLVMHTTRVVDRELADLGYDWPALGPGRVVPPLGLTGLDVHAPGMAMAFERRLLHLADFDTRPPSRYGLGRRMLHDEWVLFLAGAVGRIALIAEPLLLYRQHEANDSGGWIGDRRGMSLRPALEDYVRAAEHTAACADYLAATRTEDPEVDERLAEAARAYRTAARNWSLRAALYRAADRRSRLRMLRELMAGGAYREREVGGFGRAALGKDLAGVALRVSARR
ncbi:MAG TPA: glycosyltransferase [Solirubrobacteraceae bacterium]|nr:glycosyltransferase [Solirubrobacteraceae bacterium]